MTKYAYLTIDDAPTNRFKEKVDFLVEKHIPAIFFCEGRRMDEYPDAVQYAIQKGFIIGNHSYTHPAFSTISRDEAESEIRRTHEIIEAHYKRAQVERPARYFRFPYGDKGAPAESDVDSSTYADGQARKQHIQTYLRSLDYSLPPLPAITYRWFHDRQLMDDADWYWTYDCMEWAIHTPEPLFGVDSLEKVLARMDEDVPEGGRGLNNPESEEIILLHDMERTSDMFFTIVDRLLEKGIQFRDIPTEK